MESFGREMALKHALKELFKGYHLRNAMRLRKSPPPSKGSLAL